jgi:hypothetical protein
MRLFRRLVATLGLAAAVFAAPAFTDAASAQPCVPGLPGITVCAFTEPGFLAGGVVIVNNTYPVSGYVGAYVLCFGGTYYVAEYNSVTGVFSTPVASGPCVL